MPDKTSVQKDRVLTGPCRLKNLAHNVHISENQPGKSGQFFRQYADGKYILRKTMTRFVPERVSAANKQGFSAPDASWFRGDSLDYVRSLLFTPSARIWEYLDYATARALVEEHLSGKENRRLLIWSLLSIEWWLRRYLS